MAGLRPLKSARAPGVFGPPESRSARTGRGADFRRHLRITGDGMLLQTHWGPGHAGCAGVTLGVEKWRRLIVERLARTLPEFGSFSAAFRPTPGDHGAVTDRLTLLAFGARLRRALLAALGHPWSARICQEAASCLVRAAAIRLRGAAAVWLGPGEERVGAPVWGARHPWWRLATRRGGRVQH